MHTGSIDTSFSSHIQLHNVWINEFQNHWIIFKVLSVRILKKWDIDKDYYGPISRILEREKLEEFGINFLPGKCFESARRE